AANHFQTVCARAQVRRATLNLIHSPAGWPDPHGPATGFFQNIRTMKCKPLFFAVFLFIASTIFAQKYDYNWIGMAPNSDWRGALLKFEEDTFSVEVFTDSRSVIFFSSHSLAISDYHGRLQFFTNGNAIASWDNTLMENGTGLNDSAPIADTTEDTWMIPPYATPSFTGIPDTENPYVYYLLHQFIDNNGIPTSTGMQITKIDMSKNNGKGRVEYKNRFLNHGSFHYSFQAIKHGNGRDWWIIQKTPESMNYLATLLHRDSVVTQIWSSIDGFQQNHLDSLGSSAHSLIISSPEGDFLIDYSIYYPEPVAKLMHFDRCSGQITLVDTIQTAVIRNFLCNGINEPQLLYYWTMSFSPSERYMYGFGTRGVGRWDMKASDFKSTFEEIYKTTDCSGMLPTGWLVPAPNGDLFDIYLNVHFRLRNPDQPASASDICYPHYFTPSCIGADEYYFFNPLYPNYRLGPLEGSPCDTLNLEPPGEAPGEEWTLSVGPSPAASSFTVRLGQGDAATRPTALRVYDVLGRRLYDLPL
ncbi:MAG: hypothetical protein D6694_04640, partial [Gammaproteobacteria bacterium]